jgi:UDP-N-acetylglucosamine diphosphorylase/glucosamine-1-phosphate N-acetyltransferase
MHVVIFEGIRWDTFAPLSLSKPTFLLPCGMGTLLDKQIDLLHPTRLSLWVRPEFANFCREHVVPDLKIPTTVNQPLDDQPALLATGRTLHLANFEIPQAPAIVIEEGDMVRFAFVKNAAGLSPEDVMQRSERWLRLRDLPHTVPQARYVDRLWDLISWNEEALVTDFVRWRGSTKSIDDGPWHLVNSENICLASGVKLSPGCVLDGSKGPIVIDANASVGANAVIQGPCYIGKFSQISPLAVIRPGTTIGMMCKVGGEISNSIVSPFTNKAHDGFLGDSFLGSWVNFGAGTTTSNLKNTYGEVTVKIGSSTHRTGRRMLGSIVGDHTRTAIGTRLNTGSYIGYCCLLAGNGLAPKFMPSFTFWTAEESGKYELSKAKEVAGRVMERRQKQFTPQDGLIMDYVTHAAPMVEA